jgi:hypothetical protein
MNEQIGVVVMLLTCIPEWFKVSGYPDKFTIFTFMVECWDSTLKWAM